ncbi:UvrD-helicase domain-containing protein [Candidatus Uhrbacteria bacterium]|nr:UvrD-helicase domain-containing protein [Candidatus Uhrbacteria bacterium]
MATGRTDVQLNAEQKKAVTHGDGPLLIVAGAGTGKTTVVTERILWLIQEKNIKPENILALTFTEKAAEEMIERIDRALPYGYVTLWASTFHAFCQRILEAHALDIGIPNDFRLVNDVDAWLLVRKHLGRFHLDYYRPLGNPTKFIHALVKHFSRCKDEAVEPSAYLEYAKTVRLDRDVDNSPNLSYLNRGDPPLNVRGGEPPPDGGAKEGLSNTEAQRINEIADAYHTYQQNLLENSALDFGDLVLYTLKLFRERPAILEKYRAQFQHILVDEFQDTNWTQYELVKLLVSPRNNITVVSDDDQAIYRWRGASYNNVVVFARDFPSAKKVSLVANYRSQQNILDLAYAFIQHNNPNRLEAQLHDGKTELGVVTKKLNAHREGLAVIEHIASTTEFDEARVVAQKIIALRSPLSPWSDFCILVRANAAADPFLRALEREGIPYQYFASRGLYAKPVILDCIAYLRLLDNYHESTALYRILTTALIGLAQEDVVALTAHAGKKNISLYAALSLAATLGLSKEGVARCHQLSQWILRHSALARTKPVGEVLYAFLNDSGYLKELTARVQHAGAGAQVDIERIRYLEQFFKKIVAFEAAESDPTVQRFLAILDYALEAGEEGALNNDTESGPDTVKVMTIHAAKGLEFRYVFIVQMVELRFPSVDRKDPIALPDALVQEIVSEGDAHLEEERRLFYVAMTRARDGLFLTSAEDYGGQRKKRPSRFLFEVGIIEKSKTLSTKSQTPQPKLRVGTGQANSQFGIPISTKKETVASTASLPLPERFSFTQLKAFETCPLQYKFAHLLRIPVRGRFTFSFGKSMHATLQKFFQKLMDAQQKEQGNLFTNNESRIKNQESIPSLNDLLKIYDDCWIDEWYESKKHEEEYYAKGKRMLTEFYAIHEKQWPMPAALEQPFTMKVGEYTIKGVIDRIDRVIKDGKSGVGIVDYKTGNAPKDERAVEREQLYLYQIALTETTGAAPLSLTYYYLDAQKQFSFIGTPEETDAVKERIRSTINAISTSDFAATPSPQKCRNCDFKEICEYRKL